MKPYYFSAEALEDIKNMSLVVKTDKGIRNIKSSDDLINEMTVFVNNIIPLADDASVYVIKQGHQARCVKASVIL
ncbi:hypothetical protein ABEY43_06235 [Priestia megaterium]